MQYAICHMPRAEQYVHSWRLLPLPACCARRVVLRCIPFGTTALRGNLCFAQQCSLCILSERVCSLARIARCGHATAAMSAHATAAPARRSSLEYTRPLNIAAAGVLRELGRREPRRAAIPLWLALLHRHDHAVSATMPYRIPCRAIPCRAGYCATCDTLPDGIPCQAGSDAAPSRIRCCTGSHAAWDT